MCLLARDLGIQEDLLPLAEPYKGFTSEPQSKIRPQATLENSNQELPGLLVYGLSQHLPV
jgi:hypothetical protein